MDTAKSRSFDISSAGLHITAMVFMLLDHMWATVLSDYEWLTCLGRIAFPIFAFLIAEGYCHTGNFRRYMLRLLAAALISEIPFNLMCSNSVINPFRQNVLWTFLIAMLGIRLIDKARSGGKRWLYVLTAALTALFGYLLGIIAMTDYNGAGVLTVIVFWLFRERKWWNRLCQIVLLYWINIELLGGLYYPAELFGMQINIVQQGFALLALIPIWLYRGRQGLHSKAFRYSCYAFYPAHMLLLVLLARAMDALAV